MTAAIPVHDDPVLQGHPRGGFRNSTANAECRAIYVEGFFGKASALIASTEYGQCATMTSETEKYVYHTNYMRVHGAMNNAIVTCACDKASGECMATAQWEHKTQAIRAFDGKKPLGKDVRPVTQGRVLSSGLIAGPDLNVSITNDDDVMVFESTVVGSARYPWPMLCDAVCPQGYNSNPSCVHHLIVNGCPTDDVLDFRVRSLTPGRIVFSVKPMKFEDHDSMKIQCMMATFPNTTNTDEQCEWSGHFVKKRRRLFATDAWDEYQRTGSSQRATAKAKAAVAVPGAAEIEGQGLGPLPTALGVTAQNPFNLREGTIITEVSNEIVYDNWAVQWGRDIEAGGDTAVQVGNDFGFVGVGIGFADRETSVNTGWGKLGVSVSTDESDLEGGVGVSYGAYSVRVDQDLDDRQTAVEVVARGVESGTNVDILDRDYGQRVKVRNTEVAVRHDFNDQQDPTVGDDEELATEVFAGYKSVAVAVGTDVDDTEYAVSTGVLGYQFSVLRDFDERETDFQGNWADGYQLVLNGDFPDPRSTEVFIQVGFGVLGVTYVQVGAGVGGDGIPQGSAEVETEDFGLGVDFIDDAGDRLFLYSITVGKFTYIWESEVVPDNLDIPLILGAGP
ncbi:unnamed protein product [Vitrella brassicaformis CCMP3155]|uniref:Uncharacterized protein n=1 Tax=Vitrella brassicaformis (strain CCMP3155) TaxID=1169540 RepID=A0A0G4EFD9_VITBC|nr:unnamed protein product [Vitrella brassicaformis CCMP3155]|eukprot:CEL94078.1 unnamed protein product [Vitrella brassicaformis CCMP3155]